jgi:hypothetical protein
LLSGASIAEWPAQNTKTLQFKSLSVGNYTFG